MTTTPAAPEVITLPPPDPLKFGDHVYYDLRGVQRIGRVTHRMRNNKGEVAYHVVDDDGYYWHRSPNELALYLGPVPLVPVAHPTPAA